MGEPTLTQSGTQQDRRGGKSSEELGGKEGENENSRSLKVRGRPLCYIALYDDI